MRIHHGFAGADGGHFCSALPPLATLSRAWRRLCHHIATPDPPAAPAAGRWPDVLDVHLTAQLLTVSADTGYDLLQRGDLPGRKVGRKWLTTKTAVLKWLEQSAPPRPTAAQETALARAIAHGDTAALVDAVRTGKRGSAPRSSTPRGQAVSGDFAPSGPHHEHRMGLPWFPRTMSCDNSQDHDCTHIYSAVMWRTRGASLA